MAREAKRNKTKIEKLIMTAWIEANKGNSIKTDEQMKVLKATKKMLKHFDMEDYLHGSHHVEIIHKLYLTRKYDNMTQERFSKEVYISERTLRNYVNDYIKCFEKIYNDLTL